MYYIELEIEREHKLCIDLPVELGNDINRFNEKQPYSLFKKLSGENVEKSILVNHLL